MGVFIPSHAGEPVQIRSRTPRAAAPAAARSSYLTGINFIMMFSQNQKFYVFTLLPKLHLGRLYVKIFYFCTDSKILLPCVICDNLKPNSVFLKKMRL